MTIVPVNDVWVRVDAEPAILREISDHFTFDVDNHKFIQRQTRYRGWSGKIHLFKLQKQILYRGLVPRLLEFAAQQGYPVENRVPDPTPVCADIPAWIAAQTLPVAPRDYQVAAVHTLLTHQRGIVLSPTGSGKSLIIHLVTAAVNAPTLIVVPTTGLVAQLSSDLRSYGCPATDIQNIHAGLPKAQQARIVLSTWQSIYKLPPAYFAQFQCVIVDEVHLAKSKSLSHLLEKCETVPYRFGFTGTLDDTQAHRLVLEGLFGQVTRVTSTHTLMAQQHLTPLRVKMCVIQYAEDRCRQVRQLPYQEEVDAIVTDPARLDIVALTAAQCTGTTLVLFNFVEKHGKPLFQRLQDIVGDRRPVYFVSGEVAADDRERIRQWVAGHTHSVIVASYGTFSTGINIPNIHTLIFASPSKSKIRVLQSVGRSLRLHESKTHATLIDFVDDFRVGRHVNHTFRHGEQRAQYYASEKFPFTVMEQPVDVWLNVLQKRRVNPPE